MKPKIAVLGWYGKKNVGDESYKRSFPHIFPEYDFCFTDTLTPKTVAENDGFILGGGDIMAPKMITQFDGIQKPKHIISATASNKDVQADKLARFNTIIVRDYHSIELLQEKGVKATWLPDIAMTLRGNAKKGVEYIKSLFVKDKADLYEKVVAVVVNSYLLNEDHPENDTRKFINYLKFCQELASVCDSTPASFVFVPFGGRMPFDDRVTCSYVASRCKFWQKNVVVYDDPDVQTTLDVFAAVNCVISSRLHSSIFACAQGTPFLDVTWNHKNRWFLETISMTELSVPYRSFDVKYCTEKLDCLLFNGEDVRDSLAAVAKKQTSIITNSTKFTLTGKAN